MTKKIPNTYLSKKELSFITKIFLKYLKDLDFSLYLFGSRATGKASKGSDIDIIIKSKSIIALSTISLMKEEFENSNFPYTIDIVQYDSLYEGYINQIKNTMIKIY